MFRISGLIALCLLVLFAHDLRADEKKHFFARRIHGRLIFAWGTATEASLRRAFGCPGCRPGASRAWSDRPLSERAGVSWVLPPSAKVTGNGFVVAPSIGNERW